MFLKLPDNQINTIKSARYPTVKGDQYTVTIKSSGTDNIIDLAITLDAEDTKKVFDNELSKYLKLKLFFVRDNVVLQELNKDFTSHLQIEQIIQKYKLLNQEVSVINENIYSKDANQNVSIKKSFILPEQKILFLTFGHYFYYDLENYVRDFSLSEEFLDKKVFWDKNVLIDLVRNDVINNNRTTDLRKVKSILQNINALESLNANLDLQQILNKKLKESKLVQPTKRYFSNPYIIKNNNNNLSFIFNLDYKNIISDNSIYKNIINNNFNELSDIYKKINRIKNIKIIRKQKKINSLKSGYKFYDIKNSETVICNSSFNDDDTFISVVNDKCIFKNIDNGIIDSNTRLFSVTDFNALKNSGGVYDYGVEVDISNNLSLLFKYLAEDHMSSGVNTLNQLKNLLENPNNYNPLDDTLSTDFVQSLINNSELNSKLASTIDSFFIVLKAFGYSLDATTEDALNSIFDFTKINIFNIQYFINIYSRVQSQLLKITQQKYQNNINVKHWFNKPYLGNKNINYGYKFFNNVNNNEVPIIDSQDYLAKITSEINKYTTDISLIEDANNPTLYSYITPSVVQLTNNKTFNLDILADTNGFINTIDFFNVLSEIKKINLLDNTASHISGFNNKSKLKNFEIKRNTASLNSEIVANKYSITTNLINNKNDSRFFTSLTSFVKDDSITTDRLMMQVINNASGDSISKKNNVSLSPNEVIPNILNVYNNPNQNFNTMMYSAMIKVLPLHLKSLMNNNSKLFKENDKYLKNIELKSKFMLLFDTIHKVEYLTYDSNTGEEVWTVLTKNSLDNFTNGSIQICRLINYVNNSLEIQGIKNIELPIYNEYFMLKINNSKPYIPLLYSFIKNKFVPPVVNSQLFNKKNAPFKQVDKYKNTNVKQTLQLLNDKLNKSNIDSSIKFEQNLNKLFNKIKKP